MGLFEEAGRRFERFKQRAEAAADEDADFECAACGERLFGPHDECPECGSDDLVSLDEPAETDDAAGTDDASDADVAADTAETGDPSGTGDTAETGDAADTDDVPASDDG